MSIKSLFAVHFTEDPIESLDPLVDFASSLNARLRVVVFGTVSVINSIELIGKKEAHWSRTFYQILKQTDERVVAVRERIKQAGVSVSVVAEYQPLGLIDQTASHHAICTDMAVLTADRLPGDKHHQHVLHGVLMDAGLPVLAIGGRAALTSHKKSVLIAWNESPQAARAVRQALNLIDESDEVHLLAINSASAAPDSDVGNDLIDYLSSHGICSTVKLVNSEGASIAETIIRRAEELGADLVIMGAYGHSRLRERLLGATADKVLTNTKSSVLMAH